MRMGARLGCHQLPERSFFIHGYQFPVCARCTGIYIGYIAGIFFQRFLDIPIFVYFIMCCPMVIDGITQLIGFRTSNQMLRLATGLFFGIGSIHIFVFIFTGISNKVGGIVL